MTEPSSRMGGLQPEPSPAAGGEPRRRPRVLVAEDEAGTLALMSDMLRFSGFDVVQARDGLEALVHAREARPDLALLDVMMPGMDGRDVCRHMRGDPALSRVPVILVSSADGRDVAWQDCGAVAFLQKPFRIRELPELVRRHLPDTGVPDAG